MLRIKNPFTRNLFSVRKSFDRRRSGAISLQSLRGRGGLRGRHGAGHVSAYVLLDKMLDLEKTVGEKHFPVTANRRGSG